MRRRFTIAVAPFSINSKNARDMRFNTSDYNEWSAQVFHALHSVSIQETLKELREYFDPKKHDYHVCLTAFYPADMFYTKQGVISNKTMDITNWEKLLVDLLWLPKYFERQHPYGCKNLNTDDKSITQLISRKQPWSKDYKAVEVRIRITNRSRP